MASVTELALDIMTSGFVVWEPESCVRWAACCIQHLLYFIVVKAPWGDPFPPDMECVHSSGPGTAEIHLAVKVFDQISLSVSLF